MSDARSPPRRLLHAVFALGPLVAFAAWLAWAAWQVHANVVDLDGLAWGEGAGRLTAERESSYASDDPETENITLRVTDVSGAMIHRETFSVDRDRWGWGLVEALQVDADPEPEIVFIDHRGRDPKGGDDAGRAFYLDLSSGRVERKPLASATRDVLPVVDRWASLNNPLSEIMLLIIYYTFVYLPLRLFGPSVEFGRRRPRARIEPVLGAPPPVDALDGERRDQEREPR